MKYVFFVALTGAASGAWATPDLTECRFTQPPQVIEGISATKNQMDRLGGIVKAYVEDMNRSLACLEVKEAALGADITAEDKALIDAVYNQGVEQIQVIAQGYNDQVEVFNYKDRIPQSEGGLDVIRKPGSNKRSD